MYKVYKWFLVSAIVVLLTACGGGGGSTQPISSEIVAIDGDSTQLVSSETVAIDKIVLYATDNSQPVPTILDYNNAGVVGVTAENIDDINAVVSNLTREDVDTSEEIQVLVDDLGIVIPDDVTPPVITINGADPMTIIQGNTYTEPGATAVDAIDGSVSVTTSGNVDVDTVGTYTITYSAEDSTGNTVSETRIVNVVDASTPDDTPPVITLNGVNPMTITEGETYSEPGATAVDDRDGSVSITTSGNVDVDAVGIYTITYSAEDAAGNTATETRTVNVVLPEDITPPVITLNGVNPVTVIQGDTYTEAGATAVDAIDGSVSVTTSGNVDVDTVGIYTITYQAEDAAGNSVSKTRTVNVVLPEDVTPPVITLNGENPMMITEGETYSEPGATAVDAIDGSVSVTTSGSVDTDTVGIYTITYRAEDTAGNIASKTRTVNVIAVPTSNLDWNFIPSVAQGTQFDAQVGPNNLIHLISSRYYQLNLTGDSVVEENQGDEQQGLLSFPPAIAVGDDGSVHIVTRHTGTASTGYDIRYRRRSSTGSWNSDYTFGGRVARNYVVGVSWTDADIIMSSTHANVDGLWGDIHLWNAGVSSASNLGALSNIWRADTDSRLRAQNATVKLVSGKTNPDGRAYFSQADTGTGLVSRLNTNMHIHNQGTGRRGFPDVSLDGQNNSHFVYGTEFEVYYNKYNASGTKIFESDKRIFSGLGSWHSSAGLSAIAVSDSGELVVAVALRAKGDDQAANSDILWTYSTDGGISWSTPQDTGKNSDAGEGRRRPRLVAVGDSFVLLFGDTIASGISMSVLTFR